MVRPYANSENAMSSTIDKNTVTKRKSVKKQHIQKYDSNLEVDAY